MLGKLIGCIWGFNLTIRKEEARAAQEEEQVGSDLALLLQESSPRVRSDSGELGRKE